MDYQCASRFSVQQKPSKRCLQPKYPFPRIYQKIPNKLLLENKIKNLVIPVNTEIPEDIKDYNATVSAKLPHHNPLIKTLSVTNLIREEVQNIFYELNLTNTFLRKEEVDYIIEKCVKSKLAASQVEELNCENAESDSDAKPDIEVTVQMLNDNDKSKLIVENFQILEQRITKLEEQVEMAKTPSRSRDNNLNTISTKPDLHPTEENREPFHKDVAVATEPVTDCDADIKKDADTQVELETTAFTSTNTDECIEDENIENSENQQEQVQKVQIETKISNKCDDMIQMPKEFNYYDEFYYLTRQRDRNQLNKNLILAPFQMSKQPQINPFAKPISAYKPHGGLIKGQKARFIS